MIHNFIYVLKIWMFCTHTRITVNSLNFLLFHSLHSTNSSTATGEVEVDRAAREVTLSMLFKWYKSDFGQPEVLLPWLLQVRCCC